MNHRAKPQSFASSPAGKPAATFVIPTRNRASELRQLLSSLRQQTVTIEVIVLDDGSTDSTAEIVIQEFPEVRFVRLDTNRGPCFQRNRGTQLASCNIVFPVDDDTIFVSPRTVEQTLLDFDDPRVGAVAIPFINIRQNSTANGQAPDARNIYACHAYVGAAHALRADIFLKLGGYREHFFIVGEEGDYCVRMLNAGYITRVGRADPIHHLESPIRDSPRADRSGRSNDILFAWHNVPLRMLPAQLAVTTIKGVWFGVAIGRPIRMIHGIVSGYVDALRQWRHRRPVRTSVYRLFRRLKKNGPFPLAEIESDLPSIPGCP